MNKIGLRVIKTAIGSAVAIMLAQALGLRYPYAAAIITLLSIQNTRRKSIDVVQQRIKATILSLTTACVMFLIFGFNAPAFGLYILIFIPLTVKFNASEGISTSAVLATHILGEAVITGELLINELALMAIGTGVAIVANLYMPPMLKKIAEDKLQIEDNFQIIVSYLREKIHHRTTEGIDEKQLFSQVKKHLEKAKARADQNQDNYVLFEVSYYAQYMEMRFLQFEVLIRLSQILDRVTLNEDQSTILANLTEDFILYLHDAHTLSDLIMETEKVIEEFQEAPLPKTRDEFINQTLIFKYLNEFHHLGDINQTFISNLRPEEKALEQALLVKESTSLALKVKRIKDIKKFKRDLRDCYRRQLPVSDSKVQGILEFWKTFHNNNIFKTIEVEEYHGDFGLLEYFKKIIKEGEEQGN